MSSPDGCKAEMSTKDSLSMPDSTKAPAAAQASKPSELEKEFSRTLAQYGSAYKCLVEDVLKQGSGKPVDASTVDAEKKRLARLEAQLAVLTKRLSLDVSENKSVYDGLKKHLEEGRKKIDKIVVDAKKEASGHNHPHRHADKRQDGHSHSHSHHRNEHQKLEDYSAQQTSSAAYARLYYSRLIFWAILVIMVMIVMGHAATSDGSGMIVNSVGVVISLIIMYYVLRFVYNKVF